MVFDLPPTIYIAQVYNCDAYGAAAYNSCPETSETTNPSSNNSSTGSRSSTGSSQDSTTTSEETTTTETPQTTTPTTPPKKAPSQQGNDIELVTPANTVAAMDWTTIVPIALVISVLIALIVLLFKKHRRNNAPLPPTY